MRMKKFFKIGVLLLFMIGLFTVQQSSSTVLLVDDDVGMEYIDNLNFSPDDAVLTIIIENPGQVASPLKYPCYSYQTITYKVAATVCIIDSNSQIYSDNTIMANKTFTNGFEKQLTNLSENKQPGKTNKAEGLFRLNIGENLSKTVIC